MPNPLATTASEEAAALRSKVFLGVKADLSRGWIGRRVRGTGRLVDGKREVETKHEGYKSSYIVCESYREISTKSNRGRRGES